MIEGKIRHLLKSKTLKDGFLFSVFSFFNKGLTFLLLMILAKYLNAGQYGTLSLFNTVITFLGFTIGLSTAGYLGVSYFANNNKRFKIDLTSILIITILGSCFFLVLIIVLNHWLVNILKLDLRILLLALYISFSSIIIGMWLDYYRVKEKVKKYGIISCCFAVLNFAITLYLIVYLRYDWVAFVYSQTICNLIFSVGALLYFFKKNLFILPFNWESLKKILIWGIPLIPHSASIWLKQGIDRYIIDYYYSISEVGLFSFALNLANIIVMIGVAFNQTNSVNIYKTLSATDENPLSSYKRLRQKEFFFLAIYAAIALLVIIFVSILVPYFLPNYSISIKYFILLSICSLFHCYYLVYCNYLFYFNKTAQLMNITFGFSIFHLILSLLITKYSLIYTCSIYILTQLLTTFFVYKISRNILNKHLHEKNI